jgi:SAM-dependent methyltransferase
MELSTIHRLTALNRRFYAEHAENFADARPRLPAGVQRVLAGVKPGARVLEVGCGDGKVGRALARAGVAVYVGLDSSEAMLERAAQFTRGAGSVVRDSSATTLHAPRTTHHAYPAPIDFKIADLASPSWPSALPTEPFDWTLAFAVFHHLPGYALRAGVLATLANHLAPGGRVALSNWVFIRSERLKKRIVPWEQAGLSQDDVEPGDYLLSWERKGQHGLRYVHVVDSDEVALMAADAGLRVVETFRADGVTDDLSDYVVMEHAA